MLDYAFLIPLIPLAASLIILLGGKEDPHSPLPYVGVAAMAWCLVQSLFIFWDVATATAPLLPAPDWTWFSFGATAAGKPYIYDMPLNVLIDGPAALMLVVVTLVSLLVQVYSLAYMHGDARFKRYFAFLSFFTASMLGLVVSNNLFVTFACWELVGVSSYLLIGFWFEKQGPPYAAKKAFMTTKLGDCGLYLALLMVFIQVGSFQFTQIREFVALGYMPPLIATVIGLGILFGAAGKSAQFPLFIWLPDAMEGPTPVSALIHAATMVAAGVYLVGRMYFLFAVSPTAMEFVAWAGAITAFMAATMAMVSYDIKRVLAFSTVSQLGFMMCALGAYGYTAGLFHLTTHAFFKALLFLGAGSVIHAVHTNDMRQMGGLSKKMPVTFVTMFIASLSIGGFPLLSGWWSKEMILEKVFEHDPRLFYVLTASALMTAFYMFRMIFLTFTGNDRDHEKHHHAHESPLMMTAPLVLLAFLSVFTGWLLHRHDLIGRLLPFELAEHAGHHFPHWLGYAVTGLACGSMVLSWFFYGGDLSAVTALKEKLLPLFNLLERRYFLDEFFLWLVDLCDRAAKLAFWFDAHVIDQVFIDGWGLVMKIFAELSNLFDALFVDKTVDGFGGLTMDVGVGLRSLVTNGQIQEYLMYIAVAVSLFATLILSR
ncbi:MAG: NADH-quinone oxidoreductase subunit L [Elusimicrobiota bacterium]